MRIKKLVSVVLATAFVATGALSSGITAKASGTWEETDGGWKYKKESGVYAANEYIDGWWIDENGVQSYSAQASWKKDSTGWWYEDTSGWYPTNTSYRIDGTLYYFNNSGYIYEEGWVNGSGGWWYQWSDGRYAANEWVDGYWLGADGYWTYAPTAQWYKDSVGWYYMDSSGYYEKDGSATIDGHTCWFDENGYLIEYTVLVPAKTGSTTVTLGVSLEDKNTAAKQMGSLLGAITKEGSSTTLSVDGEKKTVSNKSGVIYINDESLTVYVNKVSTTSTNIKIDFDAPTNKVFEGITLAGTNTYKYDVTVGDVTFKNIKVSEGLAMFEVDGKTYSGTSQDGALYVHGDVSGANWVKALKSAGAIQNETPITY